MKHIFTACTYKTPTNKLENVYDDYGFMGYEGVTKYVEEQIKDNDKFVLYNLNGHAIVIKL